MKLRDPLTPTPIPPGTLSTLSGRLRELASLIEHGQPHARELAVFNAAVGGGVDATDIGSVHAGEDAEDFVRRLLNRPRRVPDITRAELIEVVHRITTDIANSDFYLELFELNVPHPEAGDLIFWPPDELREATYSQIVDAALRYRALIVDAVDTAPPPSGAQ